MFTWHELMSQDPDRSERFYEAVAGVTFQPLGPEPGSYRMMLAGGRPIGGVTGPEPGRSTWPSGGPEGHWVSYFDTDDVDGAAERARALGGTVLLEPVDIPGTGRAAVLRDPDGATFGVFLPASRRDTGP